MYRSLIFWLQCVTSVVEAYSACTEPRIRKEWRALTGPEKSNYLSAVKCMFDSPSKTYPTYPGNNRHDDFVALHINLTSAPNLNDLNNLFTVGPGVHGNGVFLPWHRYLLWIYESTLRDECGLTGAQPYWDWSLDTSESGKTFKDSPIFDPVLGFGGNGLDGTVYDGLGFNPPGTPPAGSCIGDGPFAGIENPLGYGYNLTKAHPHCLKRNFQPNVSDAFLGWRSNVLPLFSTTDFENFTKAINSDAGNTGALGGVHANGHRAVGGEVFNFYSSPNDPLFFMHHCQIDRIWSLWQSLDPGYVYSMGGPIYPNGTGVTTLDYPVEMIESLAPAVPIRQVMDTVNNNGQGILCYEYEENGQPTS